MIKWGKRLFWITGRRGGGNLSLTSAAGSSHLYHLDSFNSRRLRKKKKGHSGVIEGTNVRPGSQLLTWIHNLEVNTVDNAYV